MTEFLFRMDPYAALCLVSGWFLCVIHIIGELCKVLNSGGCQTATFHPYEPLESLSKLRLQYNTEALNTKVDVREIWVLVESKYNPPNSIN